MGPVGTGDWGLGLGLDNLPSEIIFKKAYAFIYVAFLNICSTLGLHIGTESTTEGL